MLNKLQYFNDKSIPKMLGQNNNIIILGLCLLSQPIRMLGTLHSFKESALRIMCTIGGLGRYIGRYIDRYIGRLSTDYRPIAGRQSADSRPIVGRLPADSRPIYRPIVGR